MDKVKGELLAVLPACITRAIQLNGQLGEPTDYPSPQAIVDLFDYEWDFAPIADASGFAGLPEGFEERFAMNYETKVAERMKDGIEETKSRLGKQLNAFSTTLGSEKPRFFQGTVDNISQLGATLRGMNMTDDPDLSTITTAVADATQYSAAQLRDNMTARIAVTATVTGLITAMGCASNTPVQQHMADMAAIEVSEVEVPTVGTEPVSVQDQFDTVFAAEDTKQELPVEPEHVQEAEPVVEDDPNGISDILSGLF